MRPLFRWYINVMDVPNLGVQLGWKLSCYNISWLNKDSMLKP